MFFANISFLEFAALLGAASAATVALYLLIRSRRRHVVGTLRFWQASRPDQRQTRRRRIDQPWSLILQLLALLCLLLAIAQPRFGRRDESGTDHVLLLDSSAWMLATPSNPAAGSGPTLADDARKLALKWVAGLPARDRVMVLLVDALATPAVRFTSDRRAIEAAIRNARPGPSALDLQGAFDLAVQALRMEARRGGEIVYAGPGMISPGTELQPPPGLRILSTPAPGPNVGITRMTVRRSSADPQLVEAVLTARNYSNIARTVPAQVGLGGALILSRSLTLPALSEVPMPFTFKSTAAGWLDARLDVRDALPEDNRTTLEFPPPRRLRVLVYTEQPELFRAVLASEPRVAATFAPQASYDPAADADLLILDSFNPLKVPTRPALQLRPGALKEKITAWNPGSPLAAGLRSHDLRLVNARVLSQGQDETVVARIPQGPVITARQKEPKLVTFGFDPVRTALRYELTTPLLFVNVLRWMAPTVFEHQEALAGTPGPIDFELAAPAPAESVRVLTANGAELPFTVAGRNIRFFTNEPSAVRVLSPGSEAALSLSLPGLGAERWAPPSNAAIGVGAPAPLTEAPKELWQLLALAGLLCMIVEWWIYGRRRSATSGWPKLGIALKAAAAAAVLISLFQPDFKVRETKLAVALLADTSSSIPESDLARESQIVTSIENAKGRNAVRVLPFADSIRLPSPAELASGGRLRSTAGESGRTTNLEGALREAFAILPTDMVPRAVLISDGNENQGSVVRAAWQARHLGIPIDTYSLQGQPEPKLRLESVRLPGVAFTGERFPIELSVSSPASTAATLEVSAEGKTLGSSPVTLVEGANELHISAAISTPGALEVGVKLATPELGSLRFDEALSIRRPRLLYLTQDPAGMSQHLLSTLDASQFEVTSNVGLGQAKLDDYQLVVLDNWDFESIPLQRKEDFEKYVQRGGGLLIIGGERNIYAEKKKTELDPLERALPATVAPPRSPEGASVILIIDKSSSMEGRKMELARLAAIGVVENLRPIDQVGVLIFDNSYQWAVPLRRAEDRNLIKRLIAGITPDGGTQIAPALAESFKRMLSAGGAYKHIVLLTDGISEEGDSVSVAKEAANQRITISTVGLGQDVNRPYLERLAMFAKGRSYFLVDPSGLEQILLKDVIEHTGSTTVEKPVRPTVVRAAEIFDGVPIDNAPPLKGYVRYQAKPTADMLLTLPSSQPGEKDPLFVRWQFGLGRAAVFTSDAKSRWAEAWVTWPGYDKFWANTLRDLLPHAQPGSSSLTYDAANRQIVVDYHLSPELEAPAKPPQVFALGPGGLRSAVALKELSPRHYQGRFAIANRAGMFRVLPVEESRAFPEVGLYLPEPEMSNWGNNQLLLRQVAAYTGGKFNPAAREVFDPAGRGIASSLRLWPALLGLAVLLNLCELAWRRLRTERTSAAPLFARAA